MTAWQTGSADAGNSAISARAEQREGRLLSRWAPVPPLGRLDSAMLHGLAALADRLAGEIRMTPWQSVHAAERRLLPMPRGVLQNLEASASSCDQDRRSAAIVTCAGSSGCASGLADTKADALALAAMRSMARNAGVFGVHLTGCSKSCASPRPAPVTLLALSPGHYDVFLARRDTERAGFGKRIGTDLTIEQAGNLLAEQQAARAMRVPELRDDQLRARWAGNLPPVLFHYPRGSRS